MAAADEEAPLLAGPNHEVEATQFALQTGRNGLTDIEVELRLKDYGFNLLEEKKRSEIAVFLGYFWGPMPFMIWLATITVAIEGDWDDFAVLMTLQIVNGVVGYFEEKSAGDAIDALRKSLAPQARVIRNGVISTVDAKFLVPGDLIIIKLGDIVPADCILGPGKPCEVDQAALTGESLPVARGHGDKVFMGSVIRRGELTAHVAFTGSRTFFGRAAEMVNKAAADQKGRFARVMLQNTTILLSMSVSLCVVIFVKLYSEGIGFLEALSTVVVILVACIPIAMQIVSTTVMAVGGRILAEKKAILARLSAIEELAGMDILCSDKTGTLTQNKLKLYDPVLVDPNVKTAEELVFIASLAAKRETGADAIDTIISASVAEHDQARWALYEELDFTPFDPVIKRTECVVKDDRGQTFRVAKGATKVILDMCQNKDEVAKTVLGANADLAGRGFRSLGVAMTLPNSHQWIFKGVLSLFDPPRVDTKRTIETAYEMGVNVKMVTGDQTAIAIETCRNISIGTEDGKTPKILEMKQFIEAEAHSVQAAMDLVTSVDGFAEVYPEHKYRIVELLQMQGMTVGMTGDGVNDAPALKRAQIGIAVEGATDAARAASDIVLTAPGLSVIIDAITTARMIFARVRNYVIYRIACTLQLVLFFFLGCLTFKPKDYYCIKDSANDAISGSVFTNCSGTDSYENHAATYPFYYTAAEYSFCIPVLGIVIITILNDGCMLTIARDHVMAASTPQSWDLNQLRVVATMLGSVPLISSLLLLYVGLTCADGLYPWYAKYLGDPVPSAYGDHYYLAYEKLITLMYLKISISDFLTLFSARTRGPFFERLPSLPLLSAFLVATVVATLVATNADIYDNTYPMEHISTSAALFVWGWNILFFIIQDLGKLAVYATFDRFQLFQEKSIDPALLNKRKSFGPKTL